MRIPKAFTLVELLIAIIILMMAVAGVMGMSVFAVLQVKSQMERADIQTQMNFALEDMKLHFMSAARVDTLLDAGGETATSFTVLGEKDIYTITPNITTDNTGYTYMVRTPCYAGQTGNCLIRRTIDPVTSVQADEVLVDARFEPKVEFIFSVGNPPNYLIVRITAKTKTAPVGLTNEVLREEGIRLWFVDIVSPN